MVFVTLTVLGIYYTRICVFELAVGIGELKILEFTTCFVAVLLEIC